MIAQSLLSEAEIDRLVYSETPVHEAKPLTTGKQGPITRGPLTWICFMNTIRKHIQMRNHCGYKTVKEKGICTVDYDQDF